jgi:hypothetical protein
MILPRVEAGNLGPISLAAIEELIEIEIAYNPSPIEIALARQKESSRTQNALKTIAQPIAGALTTLPLGIVVNGSLTFVDGIDCATLFGFQLRGLVRRAFRRSMAWLSDSRLSAFKCRTLIRRQKVLLKTQFPARCGGIDAFS